MRCFEFPFNQKIFCNFGFFAVEYVMRDDSAKDEEEEGGAGSSFVVKIEILQVH